MEYRLYKTKSKLSSLLSSGNLLQVGQQQPQQQQQQSHHSFYILTVKSTSTKSDDDEKDGLDSIWFNRNTGEIRFKKTKNLQDYQELGKVFGYIGKFQINKSVCPRLLFIKRCELMGKLRIRTEEHNVYRIKEILVLPLTPPGALVDEYECMASVECDIESLRLSMAATNAQGANLTAPDANSPAIATSQRSPSQQHKNINSNNPSSPNLVEFKSELGSNNKSGANLTAPQQNTTPNTANSTSSSSNSNKFEKKILDEIIKVFQDNQGSFYFSYTYDMTNSVERREEQRERQQQQQQQQKGGDDISIKTVTTAYWRNADDRFFWNKNLIAADLIHDDSMSTRDNISVTNTSQVDVESNVDLISVNDDDDDENENNNNNEEEIVNEEKNSTEYNDEDRARDKFILPIIQGFFQIEVYENKLPVIIENDPKLSAKSANNKAQRNSVELKLALISRRSRFRLGTRFKRRGVDESGNVANFVETEQILNVYDGHTLSYTILRGSIPIFWSQPGIKYRPAPRIDKNRAENQLAFGKHFEQLEKSYPNSTQTILVNLIEEYGKESILGDAYVEQIADLNSEKYFYVQFDFHEHCKGLKFENVSLLVEKLKNILSDQAFCWVDKKGFIYKQKCTVRVNCVDCLDRTNVVQMVLAKHMLENQLAPLGILIPPAELPLELKKKFLQLWANNGDAISEQYAGTSALKGDYTRTGERNFTGIMKDGVKSANRFYLRFKDNYRQLALEALQGVSVYEEDSSIRPSASTSAQLNQMGKALSETSSTLDSGVASSSIVSTAGSAGGEDLAQAEREREENIRQLVADCRKQLIDSNEDCYGSWALINYNESSSNDLSQVDPDVFLLFTSSAIYISNYDDENETFVDYQKILLKDVEKLELGPECSQQTFFKASSATPKFYILRLYYRNPEPEMSDNSSSSSSVSSTSSPSSSSSSSSAYFHSFRSSNLRFFNNLVITTKSMDDLIEALRGICHTIKSTASYFGYDIGFEENAKLTKKKSKAHPNLILISNLSSRMSIDDISSAKLLQQSSTGSTLNKFKKIFNQKLFGPSSSSSSLKRESIPNSSSRSEMRPTSLGPSASTRFFEAPGGPTKAEETSLIDFDIDTVSDTSTTATTGGGEKQSSDNTSVNLLVDLGIDSTSLLNESGLSTSSSQQQQQQQQQQTTPAKIGKLSVDSSSSLKYVPKLSQKQYVNREAKLEDAKRHVIKNSASRFLFI